MLEAAQAAVGFVSEAYQGCIRGDKEVVVLLKLGGLGEN
jgi:hypothetical protein